MPWRKCTCRPTRGGRVHPGCGDPDRRTGGIRLRVMARRRGAVFRPSVSSHTRTLAHMLAPLYDGTDFRPSGNGDGAAPAGACSLRGCESAMARRRGPCAYIGYPVTKMLAHTLARAVDGRSTRRTLEHREAVVGRCPRQHKVCESVGERQCDVSGSLVTFIFRLHRRLHTS